MKIIIITKNITMKILTLREADRKRYHNEREFLFLGATPTDENCTPCGDNFNDGIIECKVLINQLIRQYGTPPEECEFFILENHHEFGIYHEAAIYFNCPDEESDNELDASFDYASKCELLPEHWDEDAKIELREAGHTQYQPAKVIKLKRA